MFPSGHSHEKAFLFFFFWIYYFSVIKRKEKSKKKLQLTSSWQVPPFAHGLGSQSSILLSHVGPSNPKTHWHV